MKELGNKIIAQVHWLIVFYTLYGAWGVYQDHQLRMEDLNSRFPEVEAEITRTTKKVKEMQEFVKKAEESKVRVEEVAKNIEQAQKQLPSEINDNQIFSFFNEEMNSLNIKDPSVVPGQEAPSTYFISKEFRLKMKGTYLQLLVFFERINAAGRIYNVKSLKLVNSESNQKGRFQLIGAESTIEAFRYNPDFKVDRGFETKP